MVSARTSPAPARVARDPCNCAPIHTHIRPACQPSEHPTCARNYRLLCTLLTLFTYALAGDTRQHCHRLQPLRERAEHAGRPCGCWVNSSPSSAPSAGAPVGPMIEIQQLIHLCAWSSRAVLLILIGPLWTDEYEHELYRPLLGEPSRVLDLLADLHTMDRAGLAAGMGAMGLAPAHAPGHLHLSSGASTMFIH